MSAVEDAARVLTEQARAHDEQYDEPITVGHMIDDEVMAIVAHPEAIAQALADAGLVSSPLTPTQVEAAARALRHQLHGEHADPTPWNDLYADTREHWYVAAEVALTAAGLELAGEDQ